MPVASETLAVRLVGTRPLLMRSARLVDPLDEHTVALDRLTRKRVKTAADHHAIARAEWFGGMWTLDGRPAVPGSAIEACLVAAARNRRAGPAAKAGVGVRCVHPLEHDGPGDLEALWLDQRFRHRAPVTVRGARVMRTRPCFSAWSVLVEVDYMPSRISRQDLLDDLVVGGDAVGLGDWRPQYGKYRVEAP